MSEHRNTPNGSYTRDVVAGAYPAPAGRGPVALVVSAHAGTGYAGGARLDRADPAELLASASVEVGEVVPVSALDHRLPQGTRWRERGFGAVVAAGGDGTVGTVATQVAGSGLPLGILPMGTSNDVARSLGIPLDLAAACRTIAEGVPIEVDAGQAMPAMTQPGALGTEPRDQPPADTTSAEQAHLAPHGAYFMHALTLGLNVSFARLATDVARRQRWGNLTYAASAIEALTQFQPVQMKLRLRDFRTLGPHGERDAGGEERVLDYRVVQVAVINMPVFGGGMNLRLPRVQLDDRLLDFVVIEALEPLNLRATVQGLLDALTRLAEGMRRVDDIESRETNAHGTSSAVDKQDTPDESAAFALPGVHRFQAREAVIETPQDVDVTLDGEIRAHTPVQVRVAPEPVYVLVPGATR